VSLDPAAVAVVVSGWPRVSETFALNELLALHRHGRLAGLFATKPGDRSLLQPGVDQLAPLTHLLTAETAQGQARQLARALSQLDRPVAGIHGYFAHRPAEVAELAADHHGVRFSFGLHALDGRKLAGAELGRRARAATLVTSCNPEASAQLRCHGVDPVELAHGVDLARFRPGPGSGRLGVGAGSPAAIELLAVGRLVEKKGFVHLLEAMARLETQIRLVLIGDGPDRDRLVARIRQLGLADRITLAGRVSHHELPGRYRAADVVVVPSVVDRAGDRDGLPNVVLEAMACGRPVVASRVAAIPAAVDENVGDLVEPGDPEGLAEAIAALAGDPARRARCGVQARLRMERRFDLTACSTSWVEAVGGGDRG
jgi:colanic acid/amylovoran biosynthesis glycosyltransferase